MKRRERMRLHRARMFGAQVAARILREQSLRIVPIDGEPVWGQISDMLQRIANIVENEARATKEAGR